MADVYVNALTTISSEPANTDSIVCVNRNTNEGQIIDYELLASKILDKLTSKTFSSLTTTSKLLTGGINELDSDITSINSVLSNYAKANNGSGVSGDFYYTKIGHICVGCGTITTSSNIVAYSDIITGLPRTYDDLSYMCAFVTDDSAYNKYFVNGTTIKARIALNSGTTLRLACMYMCV